MPKKNVQEESQFDDPLTEGNTSSRKLLVTEEAAFETIRLRTPNVMKLAEGSPQPEPLLKTKAEPGGGISRSSILGGHGRAAWGVPIYTGRYHECMDSDNS